MEKRETYCIITYSGIEGVHPPTQIGWNCPKLVNMPKRTSWTLIMHKMATAPFKPPHIPATNWHPQHWWRSLFFRNTYRYIIKAVVDDSNSTPAFLIPFRKGKQSRMSNRKLCVAQTRHTDCQPRTVFALSLLAESAFVCVRARRLKFIKSNISKARIVTFYVWARIVHPSDFPPLVGPQNKYPCGNWRSRSTLKSILVYVKIHKNIITELFTQRL